MIENEDGFEKKKERFYSIKLKKKKLKYYKNYSLSLSNILYIKDSKNIFCLIKNIFREENCNKVTVIYENMLYSKYSIFFKEQFLRRIYENIFLKNFFYNIKNLLYFFLIWH